MQEKIGVEDRGPGAIANVRNKGFRLDGADAPDAVEARQEEQYVFANREVDIGDGRPLPALTFIRLKPKRIEMFAEVARRERIGFAVCPVGWRPGR